MRTDHNTRDRSSIGINKAWHKRWMKVVGTLAAITVFCTTYALILPAITMSTTAFCGMEEHEHADACYERRLVCGFDENIDEVRTVKEVITETVLVDAGHIHDDSCFAEEKVLVCENTEDDHEHGDACYKMDKTLVCGEEEREAVYEDKETEIEKEVPAEGHTHTDACYEDIMVCKKNDHKHNDSCFADKTADLETAAVWEKTLPKKDDMKDDWKEDTLLIAKSQIGYHESEVNFVVSEDGERKGYTRYGQMFGVPHGDWCAMFVQFSLHYADVDTRAMSGSPNVPAWLKQEKEKDNFYKADDKEYTPKASDLIFFDWDYDGSVDHIGIVEEVKTDDDGAIKEIITIEGNSADSVRRNTYKPDDENIFGYSEIPDKMTEEELIALEESKNEEKNLDEKAKEELEEASKEGVETESEAVVSGGEEGKEDAEQNEEELQTEGAIELSEYDINATIFSDDTYKEINEDDTTEIIISGNLPVVKSTDEAGQTTYEPAVEVKAYPIELNVNMFRRTFKPILAYDITIFYKTEYRTPETGAIFQPVTPVNVSFKTPLLSEAGDGEETTFGVYHIPDGEDAQAQLVGECTVPQGEDHSVIFEANHFSTYTVGIPSQTENDTYAIGVNNGNDISGDVKIDKFTVSGGDNDTYGAYKPANISFEISTDTITYFPAGGYVDVILPNQFDYSNVEWAFAAGATGEFRTENGNKVLRITMQSGGNVAKMTASATVPFDRNVIPPGTSQQTLSIYPKGKASGGKTKDITVNYKEHPAGPQALEEARITNINLLVNGASIKTYKTNTPYNLSVAWNWSKGSQELKAGDYFTIQFPNNIAGMEYRILPYSATNLYYNNKKIAVTSFDTTTKQMKITFTEEAEAYDFVMGSAEIDVDFSQVNPSPKTLTASVVEGNSEKAKAFNFVEGTGTGGRYIGSRHPYYYEMSTYGIGGSNIFTFLLHETGGRPSVFSSVPWSADGSDNYEVAYCADMNISWSYVEFNRFELDSMTYKFSKEQIERLNAILANSYPFVSMETMRANLNIPASVPMNADLVTAAVQMEIWNVIHGTNLGSNKNSIVVSKVDPSLESITLIPHPKRSGSDADKQAIVNIVSALKNAVNNVNINSGNTTGIHVLATETIDQVVNGNTQDVTVKVTLNRALKDTETLRITYTDGLGTHTDVITPDASNSYTVIFQNIPHSAGNNDSLVLQIAGTVEDSQKRMVGYYYQPVQGSQPLISAHMDSGCYDVSTSTSLIPHTEEDEPEYVRLGAKKRWQDINGQNLSNPGVSEIEVQIYQDGKPYGAPVKITASSSNNGVWEYVFPKLPKFRPDGTEYVYTIEETPVAGYSLVETSTYNQTYELDPHKKYTYLANEQPYQSSYSLIYSPEKNGFLKYNGASFEWVDRSVVDLDKVVEPHNGSDWVQADFYNIVWEMAEQYNRFALGSGSINQIGYFMANGSGDTIKMQYGGNFSNLINRYNSTYHILYMDKVGSNHVVYVKKNNINYYIKDTNGGTLTLTTDIDKALHLYFYALCTHDPNNPYSDEPKKINVSFTEFINRRTETVDFTATKTWTDGNNGSVLARLYQVKKDSNGNVIETKPYGSLVEFTGSYKWTGLPKTYAGGTYSYYVEELPVPGYSTSYGTVSSVDSGYTDGNGNSLPPGSLVWNFKERTYDYIFNLDNTMIRTSQGYLVDSGSGVYWDKTAHEENVYVNVEDFSDKTKSAVWVMEIAPNQTDVHYVRIKNKLTGKYLYSYPSGDGNYHMLGTSSTYSDYFYYTGGKLISYYQSFSGQSLTGGYNYWSLDTNSSQGMSYPVLRKNGSTGTTIYQLWHCQVENSSAVENTSEGFSQEIINTPEAKRHTIQIAKIRGELVDSIDDVNDLSNDVGLTDAKFELYASVRMGEENSVVVVPRDELPAAMQGINGNFEFISEIDLGKGFRATITNLEAGRSYYLVETQAPGGRTLLTKPIIFGAHPISESGDEFHIWDSAKAPYLIWMNGDETSLGTIAIPNYSEGVELPETGGMGTVIFTVLGLVLVIGAATVLVVRRRRD